MLNALIRFSLAQRVLVLVVALVLMLFGARRAFELPVEVLPDLTKPTVIILTEAPGFAPEEVETLVTVPLENTLMGVTGVSRVRSTNDISLSLVFVEFDWDTDIYQARQFVQERLDGARLPEGIVPYMTPVASLMGNIALAGIVDPTGKTSLEDLRTLSDWTVARRIQSIPGIAEVLNMGGGIRQVQVQPDPNRMLAQGIGFHEIREAAANAVRNSTGGFLTDSAQEIMVRNLAMTTDLDAIADTVVSFENDRPIRLRDVADVVWGTEAMRGDAGMGTKALGHEGRGYPGVILSVTKSPGFDTISLTKQVEDAFEDIRRTLPEGVQLATLYRQSDFIDIAIGNLTHALRDGAIMVAVILFLFLLNVRVTLITLCAIPLSLGIAVLVFDLFDMSVNSMTLGGLAVAIGMVVDDAIVDVENVFRRLRENALLDEPRPRLEVIARASAEVRSSILYATLLVILVFVPLLALSGVEGRLFQPIAIATIVSMAASFVVSLTVIPVLASFLLKPRAKKNASVGQAPDAWLVKILKRLFDVIWLRPALRLPLVVVAVTLMLVGIGVWVFQGMGGNFLPAFREPSVVIATTTAPGTSLKQTTEIAARAQDLLLQIPEVEAVGYRVGRAERGDHIVPVSTVEFDVEFDADHSGRSRAEIINSMRETMRGIPGTFSAMSGPLADRIGHMLSGVSAKIAVKVSGDDLGELRRLGSSIAEIARGIPGLEEARVEQQSPIPQLRIYPDSERASAYGIAPGEIVEQMGALMGGEKVAEIYEGQRVYDLVVRLPSEWRESPEKLRTLTLDTKSGQRVPLSYVADIRQASGPNAILRENSRRRFAVSINPTVGDLNPLVEELERQVRDQVNLPEGYAISFEGEYVAQRDARRTIVLSSILVLVVVTVLLYAYFKSFSLVLLVLTNIPISMIGGVFLTQMTVDNVSIATLVGFIAIAGIAARNSIMMISHYLHLMRHEGESFTEEMVVRGTQERLVPVLMTALSAGIALIPLVLAADEPGKEILNPVAIVIVGGLVSSTLLGLAVTPSLFLNLGKRAAEKAIRLGAAAGE